MANNLLRKVACVGALPGSVGASLESAEAELAGERADGAMAELSLSASEVDAKIDVVDRNIELGVSLSNLVDGTLATYKEGGFTEVAVEQFKLSVESVLKSNGVSVFPASMLVPAYSAENATRDYAAEVIDKKENVLTRIFSWLYNALAAMGDAIKHFWTRLTVNEKSIMKYAEKVKAKVATIKTDGKVPAGSINLGGSAIWLTNRYEKIANPADQIVETVARFEDFIHEWEYIWKGIVSYRVPGALATGKDTEAVTKQILDLATQSAARSVATKIDFVVNHYIEIKPGTGATPLIGSTVKINRSVTASENMAPILSPRDMSIGAQAAIDALKVLRKLQKDIDQLTKAADSVRSLSNGTKNKTIEGLKVEDIRKAVGALSKACSIASWGWVNATPYYLKTIKACVRYIDASANRY